MRSRLRVFVLVTSVTVLGLVVLAGSGRRGPVPVDSPATGALGPWTSIGPAPLALSPGTTNPANFNAGRVAALAVDPTDVAHWLAGVGNGGVWESHDAGGTWTPIADAAPTLAIGAVAFAPSDPRVIYAGTGEAAGVGFTHAGHGMLRSADGGASWSVLGRSDFTRGAIHRIRVHPSNADVVMAITSRAGAGRDAPEFLSAPPPFGVWKTLNGGATWSRTLAGQATALEIDPTTFSNQYAALGDQRVGVLNDTPGASPNGVYRSTDGGATWAVVTGPWGAVPTALGRIELAIAPSNPNVLYAGIQVGPNGGTASTGLLGLFRTDNAWAPTPTWIQVPTASTGQGGYCGPGKCGYAHALTVAPIDANTVFAGGGEQGFWRCANCGAAPQWTNVIATVPVHPDLHALAWAGTRLLLGNDGGVWSTPDGGATWANHNRTFNTAMFYGAALHPADPVAILGGLRDYSVSLLSSTLGWVVLRNPAGVEWGEAEVALSSSRPNSDWMGAWLGGRVYRTRDGGATAADAMTGLDRAGAAFVAPVRQCPTNENVFVTGTNRVWRTNAFFTAATVTWTANSPADPYPFPNALDAPGTILSVAFASADSSCQTYAYGTRGGAIRLTRDGGTTWSNVDPNATLPARPVNSLAFEPGSVGTFYAAYSGFAVGTPGRPGHVYRTSDAGAATPTWSDVGPADDTPFNVVLVDPRDAQVVYGGSDTGLYVSLDRAATWTRVGLAQGLPPATIHDIQINPALNRTVVFTYGRGAYQLTTPLGAPPGLTATVAGNAVTLQWGPASGGPSSYVLRAGSSPGLSNLVDVDTGTTATALSAAAPNGTYFVRVHARNNTGIGPASNEVTVNVGGVACSGPPLAPAGFTATAAGATASFGWQASNGAATYVLEAGTASGLANLAVVTLGAVTSFQASAPPGTYFVRVRAVNTCGTGPASNEVALVIGGAVPPGAPSTASSAVNGSTVSITWTPPATGGPATGYLVEAGSAPGLANLAVVPMTASPLVATGVPGGTYFVRIRGVNAAGSGPASAELTIVVP